MTTISTAFAQIQTAAYTRLTAASLTCYDDVPENASGPYVTMGDADIEKWKPTFGRDGRLNDVFLRVWSQYAGWKEALTVAGSVVQSLHNTPLTLSTNTNSYLLFRDMRRQKDPDGIWRQVIIHFEILVEE